MPLFAFVCTKLKREGVPANDTLLELAVNSETLERVQTVDEALETVKSAQVQIYLPSVNRVSILYLPS